MQFSILFLGKLLKRFVTHSVGSSLAEVWAVTSMKISNGFVHAVSKTYLSKEIKALYMADVIGK